MEKQMQQEQVREFETYYNTMMDLIGSDGWKYLIADLSNNAQAINSVEFTKDAEDLHFRKGQLSVLANLLNLEEQMELLRQQQEDSEKEEVVNWDAYSTFSVRIITLQSL